MTIPLWVAELASAFWASATENEPFPRKLLRPIARAVPLHVVFPPELTIASILEKLRQFGIACDLRVQNRPLRACLVARNGHGIAFIDGTDPENEQRFSLAHELAHFLRDYLYPRQRLHKRLGPAALEVMDGIRPPNLDERVNAVLSHTRIGFHVHLMDRDIAAKPLAGGIADAEKDADRLAYELLAPADEVMRLMASREDDAQHSFVVETLNHHFGLPHRQALQYAGLLLNVRKRVDPLLTRLKIVPKVVEL